MLTLKNIKKIYEQSDEAVLDDINLTFNRDEFVSILGCSGAGKSTILNIIGGLDCKTSGKLLINGKDIYKYSDSNLDYYRKNNVGFIFQNYNLIEHLTVYENVMLPLLLTNYKNKHKRVLKMLDKVGLKDKKDSKICDLSGGQKQRVAISRALINNPDIILADEPTGALDYKTGYEIMNLIKKLSKNKLVIMVTHNKVLAKKYSSRIIYLDKGRVISDTNPSKKKKIYFNMKYNGRNLSIKNALLYSIKTIKAKRKSFLLTSLASSIGLILVALIISVSNGLKKEMNLYEKNVLSSVPIIIPSVKTKISDKSKIPKNKLYSYDYKEESKINPINEDFVKYINKMKTKLSCDINYSRNLKFNILTEDYNLLDNVEFSQMPSIKYIKKNYTLLAGSYPKNKNELMLVADQKNRIDKNILDALKFNGDVNVSDIFKKKMKLIFNDDFYIKKDNVYFINKNFENVYKEKNNVALKIVGIIRLIKDEEESYKNDLANEKSSLAYLSNLADDVINKNINSDIISDINKNDNIMVEGINRAEGVLKKKLGGDKTPDLIYIYPKDYTSKNLIIKYINKYNKNKKESKKVTYINYSKKNIDASKQMINIISMVLILFSSISLICTSIMIGIITYISVNNRTKEIGILRSIGASKKEVAMIFLSEVLITGASSGVIGIFISNILLFLGNIILRNLDIINQKIALNAGNSVSLILINVLLIMLGSVIPSFLASKKNPSLALKE
ncbi:MAG: ATP-binding cassette domain-containing protein [Lachnospiraceae bacterium]